MSKRWAGFVPVMCMVLAGCGGGAKGGNDAEAAASNDGAVAAAETPAPLDCPGRFDIPAAATGAPADAVGGLRLGTALDTAILFVQCQDKATHYTVKDTGGGFGIELKDEVIRQVTRVTDGTEKSMDRAYRDRDGMFRTEESEDDFADVHDDFTLLALGHKGQEKLDGIWHKQVFADGKMPAAAAAGQALVAKYGPPSRLQETAQGATMLWMYDTYGRKMTEQTPGFSSCDGTVPAAFGHISATAECGLTIAASITKSKRNELLAEKLSVGVMNPSKVSNDIAALEKDAAAADDARKQRELRDAGAHQPGVKL